MDWSGNSNSTKEPIDTVSIVDPIEIDVPTLGFINSLPFCWIILTEPNNDLIVVTVAVFKFPLNVYNSRTIAAATETPNFQYSKKALFDLFSAIETEASWIERFIISKFGIPICSSNAVSTSI